MKEKKNIERLFQEKFKNFESQPPTDAWSNIQKNLHPERQKRRVIPLWIKLSGIAAFLLFGVFLFSINFSEDTIDQITDTEPIKKNQDVLNTKEIDQDRRFIQTEEYATTDAITLEGRVQTEKNSDSENQNLTQNKANQATDALLLESITRNEQKSSITAQLDERQVLVSDWSAEKETNSKTENTLETILQNQTEEITEKRHILSDKKSNSISHPTTIFDEKEDGALVAEEVNLLQELSDKQNLDPEQPEQLITSINRWKITPNVAPVTMNSLSQGSPLSDEFVNNSKDFESLVGYGLGVNYAITSKLNIRTGINKLTLGYNTNEVLAYTTLQTTEVLANRTNITFDKNSQNMVLRSEDNFTFTNEFLSPEKGQLNQRIGYLEVPVELSYQLLDKRFGIDIIGGMSTLFLNENKISVISNGMSIPIGEANNLSDVHFSTNIGLGFRYEIFKSFEANLEPMFKYQLGTFNKNDGNFKPYILGLYTGLSFKF